MNFKVKTTPRFEKEIKRLSKKYHSIKTEYINLVNSLKLEPEQGNAIGNHCYKIRLSISSKGKGKSGGARLITFVQIVETTVYLLTIYDKADQENISNKELENLINRLP